MEKHPDKGIREFHGRAKGEEGAAASSEPRPDHGSSSAPHSARHRDLGVGLTAIAICGLLWWETTRFAKVPAALSQGIPASFFPRVLLATVAILSCVIILRGWRAQRSSIKTPTTRTLVTGALIVVGVALLPVLGMLLTLAVIALVLPVSWGERRPLPLAIYTVGLPLAIWCVFSQLLQLRFPTGIFGF
ncbi:tripartite tricarboxylate transporter TctB family protein [Hoeflea ulvae]|uniref:Tripartite tricarboxylate transporter TctB family protein n=1 Tax=Hoeflea ulvae TaxID=2983764 RepID=A0ABT3YM64_9HYPH|nr:tripartite tricarboxylate transporter TctB family protein [Hoeflea ulvae]MCY0096999.1 tripartite tricarboxylate transporter TctB family protein [Hoeflea ulvae]